MSRQDRLALSILACTGVRLDEIALLEWGQVHEEGLDGRNVRYLDTTLELSSKIDPPAGSFP